MNVLKAIATSLCARSKLGSLILVLLAGCTTLGPDYKVPEVSWLDQWYSELYGELDASPVSGDSPQENTNSQGIAETDLQFWWTLFEDPTLNSLIDSAQKENPGLRIAALRILESQAVLGIAGSALYPQLQQMQAGSQYQNTQINGGSTSLREGELLGYSVGVNAAWELDFWGRFARGVESADAAYFASIANQQDAQILLNASVADLYFAYRTLERRVVIVKRNASLQARSLEITENIFEAGQASELDVQQAKTQYLATIAAVPAIELEQVKVRNALATLLGRPPGDIPALDARNQPLPKLDSIAVSAVPALVLKRRPDVRAALWGVAAQSAQIGFAEADFYPSIALVGGLSWAGSNVNGAGDSTTLGIGPALQWNIFDYGRIENNVRVQDARLQQAIENYRNTVLRAAREIDDAAISIVKTREQLGYLDEAVVTSARALDLAQSRYLEGYADFQRVLDAQRAVVAQTERALITEGSHLSAVVDLYKALGGGWSAADIQAMLPEQTLNEMRSRTDWGTLLDSPIAPNLSPTPKSE